VHLAVRDELEVLYLDRLAGHASVPVVSQVGSRLPMHATGVGKVLLAHAPEPEPLSPPWLRPAGRPAGATREEERPMNGPESMADERVIRLLEEIRDLQREQGRRSADALRGQQESIGLQQTALRRVRMILAFASAALVLAIGMLVLLVLRVLARLG
jgi:hypothetical protein